MPISIESPATLNDYNTLGITAGVDDLIRIKSKVEITRAAAFAKSKNLPLFVLGGGSNIVLGQNQLHCVALKIEIPGREITRQTDDYTEVTVGAGENWDDLVAWSVEQNLSGIESLSFIPGTIGAAPVQNIGAYGQELDQTVVSVEAYDLQSGGFVTLSNNDCEFRYRDSMFKHAGKNRYIVIGVTLRLVPAEKAERPTYAALQTELEKRGIGDPTVADIRDAVITVRKSKLPDPAIIPTAGSFFHNPIVAPDIFQVLQAKHPGLPHWPADDGMVKLSGAWLIEQCGFKGKIKNGVGIHDKQALCIVNPGHKSATEVLAFRDEVIHAVKDAFGITLNMEPELIAF